MAYATRQQVRDFGVSVTDATDARVDVCLARADLAINTFTGRTFAAAAIRTEIVDGVYKGTIPLPGPFSLVTAVTINNLALAATQYEIRPWGLKLLNTSERDADGFPAYLGYPSVSPSYISATVKVTATFGSLPDQIIIDAATILAAQYARLNTDDTIAARIGSMKSGELSITQAPVAGVTTGNLEVDAMLSDYVYGSALVN